MPYNYYPTYTSSGSTAFNVLRNDFQSLLNKEFYNAPNVYTIQEEYVFGSGSYVNVDVRILAVVSAETQDKKGDDWKKFLFQDITHPVGLGRKYFFNGNYWVTVFTETYKNIAISCTVRRCNSVLRWVDSSGNIYSEPCALEYKLSRPRDLVGKENPVLPQGFTDCYCQLNDRTKLIKANQRFLFGNPDNRIALKVFGEGVNNYQNQQTMDDNSATLLTLSMGGNFVNYSTDDVANGIADRYLDYGTLQSGSQISTTLAIVATPSLSEIIESASAVYDVRYKSGSFTGSGSFVFTAGSTVPSANYTLTTLTANTFSVVNNQKYLEYPLEILCSGSSGSRILNIQLKGAY